MQLTDAATAPPSSGGNARVVWVLLGAGEPLLRPVCKHANLAGLSRGSGGLVTAPA